MNISVSSLGFCGHPIYEMGKLAPDIGIEIFYEWGGETYWDLALKKIMRDRSGQFSIHGPYQGDILEMSISDKKDELFRYLTEPFRLYHKFKAKDYVVHMNAPYATLPTPAEKAERLKRVEERLAQLNDICVQEGVNMLVENLAFGNGMKTLCNQQDFLNLFAQNPDLNCIVDTGHAVLGGMDILQLQKALGSRLKAYHIHDNNGTADSHQRIGTGVIDWKLFGEGVRLYTPDASLVMEYNAKAVTHINDYMEDADKLRALVAGK